MISYDMWAPSEFGTTLDDWYSVFLIEIFTELKWPGDAHMDLNGIIDVQCLGMACVVIRRGLNKPYNVHPTGDLATVPKCGNNEGF